MFFLETNISFTTHLMGSSRFYLSDLQCCQTAERRRKQSAGRWSKSRFHQRSGHFPVRGSGPALGRCRRWRCQACTPDWCLEYSWCDQANYNQQIRRSAAIVECRLLTGDLLNVALSASNVDGGVFMGEAGSSDHQQSPQTVWSCKIKYRLSLNQSILIIQYLSFLFHDFKRCRFLIMALKLCLNTHEII